MLLELWNYLKSITSSYYKQITEALMEILRNPRGEIQKLIGEIELKDKRINELELENERLRKELDKAFLDPITQLLWNTTAIDAEISRMFARVSRNEAEVLVLFFLDINDLKEVNSKYGHQAGDIVIRETSKAIKRCMREADLLARRGQKADEFNLAIIFQKHELKSRIHTFKKRLRECVENQQVDIGDGKTVSISVAIGHSIREHSSTLERDMEVANKRMYRNKSKMKRAR